MKAAILTSILLLSAACSANPRPSARPEARDYPGTLVPIGSIRSDFLARQKVAARHGERKVRFDAVLEKRGATLKFLGLTPFGTRAFLLQQDGTEVTFTPYVKRTLPFPPRYMFIDIHRALFVGIDPRGLPDGVHTGSAEGEIVTERWEGGCLMERSFQRESGEPAGTIRIVYGEGMSGGVPPARLEFHNGWFGYDLTITTQSYRPLEDDS